MNVCFVIDDLARIDPGVDASVGMMLAAAAAGHDVWSTTAGDLSLVDGRPRATIRRIKPAPQRRSGTHRWIVDRAWCDLGPDDEVWLDAADAVVVRLEPPVDRLYLAATFVLDFLDPAITVVNAPRGIRDFNEKLVAMRLPALTPPTLVTAKPSLIEDFVRTHERAVIKPVDGFAGQGVFLARTGDPNVASIIETATSSGSVPIVIQRYLPEVDRGNKRLFVLDGAIIGAVWRRPAAHDWRIGPPDAAADVTSADREIIAALKPHLRRSGIRLAGLDVIGGRLIEVNVTSPGGMHKTDGLLGTALSATIIDHVLRHTEWKEPRP